MNSKLVLVEGIPGSGKTTAAQFIRDWLAERGAHPALYLEGDLDHPADFECCFLQNPLTMYLGRHDAGLAAAQDHILETAEIVRHLDPILFYLHPGEAGETLRRVAEVRPQEWLDFVIAYHTQQGHGKAKGWHGFDGMVKFYEMRQAIELELLPHLPWDVLLVPHEGWDQDQARISAYLDARFPALPDSL